MDFHPGLNVIVGESYHGKSAIVRALRWLIWNRPVGEAFRSHWGGNTRVVLTDTDGNEVSRIRTSGSNEYRLNGTKLEAVGTSVPEEVSQMLNLNELNVETQFEPHFLITKSPGEVAKHFNKVAGLDQIDLGLSNVKSWITQIKRDKQKEESNLAAYQAQLQEYDNLDEVEKKMTAVEMTEAEVDKTQQNIDNLYSIHESITSIDQEIEERSFLLKQEDKVNGLLELQDEVEQLEKDLKELHKLVGGIKTYDREIERKSKLLKVENKVENCLEIYYEVEEYSYQKEQLKNLATALEKIKSDEEKTKSKLLALEKKWHQNTGEICPLCGNEIKDI
jgi:exonuclease SbcC